MKKSKVEKGCDKFFNIVIILFIVYFMGHLLVSLLSK